MSIEIVTATAPASWASYIVNGDPSSFSLYEDGDEQIAAIDAWLDSMKPAMAVSCEDDQEFSWSHDAWQFCPYGADVATYVFYVHHN